MKSKNTEWISFSDIMTGLMLVFMFIAILSIASIKVPFENLQKDKEELYQELKEKLEPYKEVIGYELDRDLVLKFTELDVAFEKDSSALTTSFKEKLDIFIPIYLEVINKSKYKDKIKEIRIEGHTANFSKIHNNYVSLISLSQRRSNSILTEILNSDYYKKLLIKDKNKLEFWLTSNGFGKGRALNDQDEYINKIRTTDKEIAPKSRRVELKIITNEIDLIGDLFKTDKN